MNVDERSPDGPPPHTAPRTGGEADASTNESATRPSRNNSSSLRRALAILNYLADERVPQEGVTLHELAQALDMSKSTLLRLLAPLCETVLVQQDQARRYRLGAHTAYLGHAYLERLDLPKIAHGILQELMAQCGETIHLVVFDGSWVVYVDKVDAPNPVRMYSRIGNRQPAYCTGVGKAYLAYADSHVVDLAIAEGLPRRTPQTLTTEAALLADLDRIRTRGYAVDDVENEEEIRCAGAPIFDHRGEVVAALSISGPASRVTAERVPSLGHQVASAADLVSRQLGAPTWSLLASRVAGLAPMSQVDDDPQPEDFPTEKDPAR